MMKLLALCWIGYATLFVVNAQGADRETGLTPEFERQSRQRLSTLRQQVHESQREIRELEELLNESTQILIELQLIEVDAAAGREAGLPIPVTPGEGDVEPIPTAAADELPESQLVSPEEAAQIVKKLREQKAARVLAAPKLITVHGREAKLLSGGEFPILIPQGNEKVEIDWREFGVNGRVTPTILANGRVRVVFNVSVAERDFTNSVKANDMVVPGIKARSVASYVEMDFGRTLIMSGLVSKEEKPTSEADSSVLNRVRDVGRLFQNKPVAHEELARETAFIVLLTTKLASSRN